MKEFILRKIKKILGINSPSRMNIKLDTYGLFLGVQREDNEDDVTYRKRILDKIAESKEIKW